jgi:hypothetical protein
MMWRKKKCTPGAVVLRSADVLMAVGEHGGMRGLTTFQNRRSVWGQDSGTLQAERARGPCSHVAFLEPTATSAHCIII